MAALSRPLRDVYRYVPPNQAVARAGTYIGDVLLEFSLTFTGSVLVTCAQDPRANAGDSAALRHAGAVLQRISDGLFISAVKADRPTIESAGGHRFTHLDSTVPRPRTRRFAGTCTIDIPAGNGPDEPAVAGSLGYTLDVTTAAPSDPPFGSVTEGPMWSERDDRTLASIGAVVLAPVPVTTGRAARLYCA